MVDDKEVEVYKAQQTGDRIPPSVRIIIDTQMPDFVHFQESIDTFEKDAAAIVDALWLSLPQGTIDRVVIKILEKDWGNKRLFSTSI
jgi:hypothetical protein